jgi:Pentapeptide repeats (8 copies)
VANPEHLARLNEGVEAWNQWRESNPSVKASLSEANLRGKDLSGANLKGADLREAVLGEANLKKASLNGATLFKANLSGAFLNDADLSWANLGRASLSEANLFKANLSDADLSWANLSEAYLFKANLSEAVLIRANLSNADLTQASLVDTNLEGATLTGCSVYGISVWDARLDGAKQSNLIITPEDEPAIQVDNLEVAQFIYLLLSNPKVRHVIDTITSKVVLILGRFTPERKVVLDAIREELRKHEYVPVLFDFEKPASKDLTGTISTLANMARFIIADLTDPSSVPHELAILAPATVVPVKPILLEGQREYAMFPDLVRRYHWVLEPFQYNSQDSLLAQLNEHVLVPAEAKAKELRAK